MTSRRIHQMKSILERFFTEHAFIILSRFSSIRFIPSSRSSMDVAHEILKWLTPADPKADPGITPTLAILRSAYVKSTQDLATFFTDGNK